ncbi:MAG: (2Fe-2S)-binding protein [Desulfobacteraceae bacterium]
MLNGEQRSVEFHPSATLAQVIREQAGLTGTKLSCENGDCGACTVQLDGVPVKSCLMLAVEAIGRRITTIEGIENQALKEAFVAHNGFQCGYCTSGMIVNIDALFKNDANPEEATIRSHLQSNLCRCTGYEGIEAAIKSLKINQHNEKPM